MKLNQDDRIIKLFSFADSKQLESLDAYHLRQSVVQTTQEEVEVPIRERVTEIEFDQNGFKELRTAPPLQEIPEHLGVEEFISYFNSFPNGLYIRDYKQKENGYSAFVVSPIYIANIREKEIFNIFDTTNRLQYYNFLTQVNSTQKNNWAIVTPIDRIRHLSREELFGLVPWAKKACLEEGEYEAELEETKSKPLRRKKPDSFYIPVIEVEKKLSEDNISLISIDTTLEEIAHCVDKGELEIEEITTNRLIEMFGELKL